MKIKPKEKKILKWLTYADKKQFRMPSTLPLQPHFQEISVSGIMQQDAHSSIGLPPADEDAQVLGQIDSTFHPYPPLVASRMMGWFSTPKPTPADPLQTTYIPTTDPRAAVQSSAISAALTRSTPKVISCTSSIVCPWLEVSGANGRYNHTSFLQSEPVITDNRVEFLGQDFVVDLEPIPTTAKDVSAVSMDPEEMLPIPIPHPPVVSSLVAAYLILVVIVSVAANTVVVVVRVCGRSRRVRSSHVCTLCLAVSDIAFSILVHVLMILAALGVDPMVLFNTAGCNYYGFSAMFFGTFSMCIHASVSVIRYINICHPEKIEWLQLKYVYLLILGSFVYSTCWAMGPLFHWGRYETFEFGCTLAFSDPTISGRSFVTCAFIFVLLLPLGVVLTCYMLIVLQANKYQCEMNRICNKQALYEGLSTDSTSSLGSMTSNRNTQRSLRLHYKLVRMSVVVATGYVIGWLPYAVVCMWATYGDYTKIPESVRIGASLFCKSATAYNPFIYYFMSEGFRADLRWLARRAGLSVGQSASESTFHISCRSSTRSSAKKSKDRTRENSLNLVNMERKDSNSNCFTSSHMDGPSSPLALLLGKEVEGDLPLYVISKSVSITPSSRRSSGSSHISVMNSKHKEFFKGACNRRISETPLSSTRLILDEDFNLTHYPRKRPSSSGCDIRQPRYQCRRSVSFSISPTESPEIKPQSKFGTPVYRHDLPIPHRSFSFYGFRHRNLNSKRPK